MAQSDLSAQGPTLTDNGNNLQNLWRRIFGKEHGPSASGSSTSRPEPQSEEGLRQPGLIRRVSRKVVPGLPRAPTFKRQQSELRDKLEPVNPSPAERRAVSMDRRRHSPHNKSQTVSNPRTSAPDFLLGSSTTLTSVYSLPTFPTEEQQHSSPSQLDLGIGQIGGRHSQEQPLPDAASVAEAASVTTSQYDAMIRDELERVWILNLSMHFRDKSKREKFFVTYREQPTVWRRVTISVDYRNAPENSLELELSEINLQREKSARIYEAIRESLPDIQFYDTVTNLKLQTSDGRLHVHVVEDTNEIILYPSVRSTQHLRCPRIKEQDIEFDSHMSGFVYKVKVNGDVFIKKEIPGPDSVDEFLYEINALNRLKHSENVVKFHGLVVDDSEEFVKGLLIGYAEQGALVDIIYDANHSLPWATRERWATQIIHGLSEIHELGFVQGDFTLSNIVVDAEGDAKIIDINRRGCPVGWEPPEATPLIENNQRISMYIGVKSDLYQLGMVLWALATEEDEPEAHGRPLRLPSNANVPVWYRRIVEICLSEDPRQRLQAIQLLSRIPKASLDVLAQGNHTYNPHLPSPVGLGSTGPEHEYLSGDYHTPMYPPLGPDDPPRNWPYVDWESTHVGRTSGYLDEPFFYPTRGRSPPSPLPSAYDKFASPSYSHQWCAGGYGSEAETRSVSDGGPNGPENVQRSATPRNNGGSISSLQEQSLRGQSSHSRTDRAGISPQNQADINPQDLRPFSARDTDCNYIPPSHEQDTHPLAAETEGEQGSITSVPAVRTNSSRSDGAGNDTMHGTKIRELRASESGIQEPGGQVEAFLQEALEETPGSLETSTSRVEDPGGNKLDTETLGEKHDTYSPDLEIKGIAKRVSTEAMMEEDSTTSAKCGASASTGPPESSVFPSVSPETYWNSAYPIQDLPDDLKGVGSAYDIPGASGQELPLKDDESGLLPGQNRETALWDQQPGTKDDPRSTKQEIMT
ncbi:hypothetical protein VTK73DRAFT_8353 [Phialemonium thermophilum]|uniref:Protein kinase domain-containing protein n=1 Tax=Phialemonium thermophilum TaxID=223376 RepID=A0ABR3Y699_9PEZI